METINKNCVNGLVEETEEDSSIVLDEVEEINSNRAIFRKYPELYEDEWANI